MKLWERNSPPLDGLLGRVERGVNRLPNPFVLFAGIFCFVAVLSTVISGFDGSVQVPGRRTRHPCSAR